MYLGKYTNQPLIRLMSGEGDTLTLYVLTRTDNEERIARKFPGADLVNPNEVDIGSVVSTIDQVYY